MKSFFWDTRYYYGKVELVQLQPTNSRLFAVATREGASLLNVKRSAALPRVGVKRKCGSK